MILLRTLFRPRVTPPRRIMALSGREMSFQKDQRPLTPEDEQKRRVQDALWQAFPTARSESHLAALAAPHFRRPNGKPVSQRTVRYWLRGDCLPDYMNAHRLTEIVGVEHFFPPEREK